eukprot:403338289
MAQIYLRRLSNFFFNCNYAGVIFGALTFINESEEKKKLFLNTAMKHSLFLGSNYLIHYLKFDFKTYCALMLANDVAAFLVCFPNYAMLMLPTVEYYLGINKLNDHNETLQNQVELQPQEQNEQSINSKNEPPTLTDSSNEQLQQNQTGQEDIKVSKEQLVEQYLEDKDLTQIFETYNAEATKQAYTTQRFQDLYKMYKVQNQQVSQGVEYTGFGLLACCLLFVAKRKYKK